jgi:small-conductance mechanosensitive channel
MGKGTQIALTALLIVLIAAALGVFWTSDWRSPAAPPEDAATKAELAAAALVDQRPLQNAQKLAPLATTPEELALVQQALRAADQEVDLAFDGALQTAIKHPPTPTPAIKKLNARIDALQSRIDVEEDENEKLTKATAAAKGDAQDKLQEQLDLLQGQLELDDDDLASAKQELVNAGGDKQSLLQHMKDQHDASTKDTKDALDKAGTAAALSSSETNSLNLVAETRAWWRLRSKRRQIEAVQQDVVRLEADLAKSHDTLEAQLTSETAKKPELRTAPAQDQGDTSAAMSTLAQLADDQKSIAQIDRRIQAAKDLDGTYGKWIQLVQVRERTALHEVLVSVVIILIIGVLTVIGDSYVSRYFSQLPVERRRLRTISTVVQIGVQAAALLVILLIVFGLPTQLATVLALAGAGLTVVLKDFIVGFLGWFVLMGKNGIQLGDWVEIEGVGGEVVEIGLLHTVLLETGNWTDAGHPTGRRVSFVNSYAVEGHYFNFSTSGQWLWDELQVFIASSEDPAPIAQAIQKMVAAETSKNARVAEEEWKRVTSSRGLQGFSAEPAVSVRPTSSGIEITVRYITRASERHDLRTRLYQAVIEMLQGRPGAGAVVAAGDSGAAVSPVPAGAPSAGTTVPSSNK